MPGPVDRPAPGRRLADGGDRGVVGAEIALGIAHRARRLAEHVVGIAVAALLQRLGALQRLVDVAAHDELVGRGCASPAVTAWRMTGSPLRATRRRSTPPRSLPLGASSRMRRPVSISAQVEALTNSESLSAEMALPNRRRRSCRGSAGRRSRRRGCAAAPRRGTSAPRPRGVDSSYSCRKASMPPWPTRLLAHLLHQPRRAPGDAVLQLGGQSPPRARAARRRRFRHRGNVRAAAGATGRRRRAALKG